MQRVEIWPRLQPRQLGLSFCTLALLFLSIWPLTGCEQALPPGTVASVNGELISLHSLQTLLDSRSGAPGIQSRASVAELQQNYRDTLAILIAHTLVRQELAARGMEVGERELNEAIRRLKEDFGEESLSGFLAEASLREDEWRQLMRDHLALKTFTERILEPSISISLEEIRSFYEEHKNEFELPPSALICYATADNRNALEAWCRSLAAGDFEPEPLGHCLEAPLADIPEPWQREIRTRKTRGCGKIMEQENQWRVAGVIDKYNARLPGLAEIFPFVENAIFEQKKLAAFEQWLEGKIATAHILGAPALFPRADAER